MANKFPDFSYTRKPQTWDDVMATVPAAALPPDLPVHSAESLGLEGAWIDGHGPLTTLETVDDESPQFFLVVFENGRRFLVNRAGYDYCRYVAEVK